MRSICYECCHERRRLQQRVLEGIGHWWAYLTNLNKMHCKCLMGSRSRQELKICKSNFYEKTRNEIGVCVILKLTWASQLKRKAERHKKIFSWWIWAYGLGGWHETGRFEVMRNHAWAGDCMESRIGNWEKWRSFRTINVEERMEANGLGGNDWRAFGK